MKVLSLSVGLPREIEVEGGSVLTSIFKEPVDRRLRVSTLNFEGDEQSDLTVHGGVDKAVYVYPSEHYDEWRKELPDVDFPLAVFGENLTIEGLLEDVRIGDRFRIGTAEFVVTQPRLPCYKLGIRFGRMDMLKRMLRNGRTGFYFAVTTGGRGRGRRRHRAARAVGRGPDRRRHRQALHGGREEPGPPPPRDPVHQSSPRAGRTISASGFAGERCPTASRPPPRRWSAPRWR